MTPELMAKDPCLGQLLVFDQGSGKAHAREDSSEARCRLVRQEERRAAPHYRGMWGEVLSSSGEVLGGMAPVDVREELLRRYAELAASLAEPGVRQLEDSDEWYVDLIGLPGAWATGGTPWLALEDFRSVVREWVELKLEHGDHDIPSLGGIDVCLLSQPAV
jgi:hypothetical protein